MARSLFEVLTTPPPPRPPEPKYPLFTKKFFSTKSWSPGHIFGAGILALGVFGVFKLVSQSQAQARRVAQPMPPPRRPEDERKLAQTENGRGQYGSKP